MSNLVQLIVHLENGTEVKHLVSHNAGKKGTELVIEGAKGVKNYELKDVASQYAPNQILAKRVGKDLVVHLGIDGEAPEPTEKPDIIVRDYYADDLAKLIGLAEDGEYYPYVPQEYEADLLTYNMDDTAFSYQSLGTYDGIAIIPFPWTTALGVLGGVGLAAGVVGGGSRLDTAIAAPTVAINDGGDGVLNAAEIASGVTATVTLPVDAKVGDTLNVDTNGDGTPDFTKVLDATDIANTTVAVTIDPAHIPANGSVTVDATITDTAGNTSPKGTDTSTTDSSVNISLIGPTTIDDILNAVEAGSPLTIAGTTDAEDGQTVTVTVGGKSYSVAASGGAFSIIVPVVDLAALPEGTVNVSAIVSDIVGNVAIPATDTFTKDTVAIAPNVIIVLDGDNNGTIDTTEKGVATTTNVSIIISADAKAGDVIVVKDQDNNTLGTFTVGTNAVAGETKTVVATLPAEGTLLTVTATVTDIVGNTASANDVASVDAGIPHAPTGTDKTVTHDEDTLYTFTAADFGFADADSHAFESVIITTLPNKTMDFYPVGTLFLDTDGDDIVDAGEALAAGAIVDWADLNAAKLKFYDGPEMHGKNAFTFQVVDSNSTDNTDLTPNTITIDTAAIADAPTLHVIENQFVLIAGDYVIQTGNDDQEVSAEEEGEGILQADLEAELGVDPGFLDGFDPDNPLHFFRADQFDANLDYITIGSLPNATNKGRLFLDANNNGTVDAGEALAVGSTVSKAQMDAGLFRMLKSATFLAVASNTDFDYTARNTGGTTSATKSMRVVNDPDNVDAKDGKVAHVQYSMAAGMTVFAKFAFANGEINDYGSYVDWIESGYNDIVVLIVTRPDGLKESFILDSSEAKYFPGMTINDTSYVNGYYTATMGGNYTFDVVVLNTGDTWLDSSVRVDNVDMKFAYNGSEYGTPILLNTLHPVIFPEPDDDYTVTIDGVGAGFAFTAGTNNGNGTWTFTMEELYGLNLLTPVGYTGDVTFGATYRATEPNGLYADSPRQEFTITVAMTSNDASAYQDATGPGSDDGRTPSDNETLTGTANNDMIRGYAGDDTINGADGHDMLFGGLGTDTLNGQGGNDTLYGGVGIDTLNGGDGVDTLIGEAENDMLTGGAGSDIFSFRSIDATSNGGIGVDTIMDFVTNLDGSHDDTIEDHIDFSTFFSAVGIDVNETNVLNYLHMSGTTLQIDRDGTGTAHTMTNIAILSGTIIADADLANLVTAGQFIL